MGVLNLPNTVGRFFCPPGLVFFVLPRPLPTPPPSLRMSVGVGSPFPPSLLMIDRCVLRGSCVVAHTYDNRCLISFDEDSLLALDAL